MNTDDEPRDSKRAVRKLNAARYRKRLWVSRKHPWVDRLASAWLIKRFIDRDARFSWLKDVKRRPKGAVGFDFDGADFSHAGHRVTFETLLASFGLGDDPGLQRLGAIVHFLDAGGIPVGEAAGIEAILQGIRERSRSDDKLVLECV